MIPSNDLTLVSYIPNITKTTRLALALLGYLGTHPCWESCEPEIRI